MNQGICAACGELANTRETVGGMHRHCVERLLAATRKAHR